MRAGLKIVTLRASAAAAAAAGKETQAELKAMAKEARAYTVEQSAKTAASGALARAAYFTEVERALSEGGTRREAKLRGEVAFKLALPELDSKEHIQAYIAAVAHGVALGIIDGKAASTMLYAAQIAISNARRAPCQKTA